ncbi:MAG: hypothetical protein ACTJGR_01850 [Pauljensenia sp.]
MDVGSTMTGATPRPSAGPGVPQARTTDSAPTRPTRSSRAHDLRCGIFAAFFAPIALSVLGLAVTDLQATAAVGQPLSSSEGMVGILVSGLLLVLIGVNSEDSPAGMVVTTAAALVVGVLQMVGVTPLPGRALPGVSSADLVSALSWGVYPLSVLAICAGSSLAMLLDRRQARRRTDSPRRRPLSHGGERTAVATTSMLLVAGAVTCLVLAAPNDTTEVAARGLPGILALHAPRILPALSAAALLGCVALGSRWSVMGTQVPAWLLMVLPGFFGVPVWMTLTGLVITPGPAAATAIGLAAPVVTALGLLLVTTSLGVHWSRRRTPGGTGDEEPAPATK